MAHTSAHVAHTLAAHIDEVFGLMGNGNAYFLDALLRDTSATYTAVRHEAGAVVAADGSRGGTPPENRMPQSLSRGEAKTALS